MSSTTLTLSLPSASYDIVIAAGAIGHIASLCNLDRRVLIVTDAGVPRQYAEAVASACKVPVIVTLEGGEGCKNLDSFALLLSRMQAAGFDRGDCVCAVGGGVVGDIAAFAASCYMRGIDFYNIPTTLLSQVDSSIGGKTGVNFGGVKNAVGSFYQPKKVIIDPDTLRTLDTRLVKEGLCEAIKMAACFDADYFAFLEKCDDLFSCMDEIIARALAIKKAVVEQDEKEHGLRRVLNFGHTLGHAIEALQKGALFHGECVALGMIPMASGEAKVRLRALLQKHALPVQISACKEDLLPYLVLDKKKSGDTVACVTVDKIGTFDIVSLTPSQILSRLEDAE